MTEDTRKAWEERMAASEAAGAEFRAAQVAWLAKVNAGHTKEVREDGVTIYRPKPDWVWPERESIIQRH